MKKNATMRTNAINWMFFLQNTQEDYYTHREGEQLFGVYLFVMVSVTMNCNKLNAKNWGEDEGLTFDKHCTKDYFLLLRRWRGFCLWFYEFDVIVKDKKMPIASTSVEQRKTCRWGRSNLCAWGLLLLSLFNLLCFVLKKQDSEEF